MAEDDNKSSNNNNKIYTCNKKKYKYVDGERDHLFTMGTRIINRAKFTTLPNTDLFHVEKCIHTMDIPLARYIDTIDDI